LEERALSIFVVNSTLNMQVISSFEMLLSIPEDGDLHFIRIRPCVYMRIARFIPGRDTGAIYMYEGSSESKVPYFIPAERIPSSSWQAWVLLVHMFTTIQQ
jgi:hypothetical protein